MLSSPVRSGFKPWQLLFLLFGGCGTLCLVCLSASLLITVLFPTTPTPGLISTEPLAKLAPTSPEPPAVYTISLPSSWTPTYKREPQASPTFTNTPTETILEPPAETLTPVLVPVSGSASPADGNSLLVHFIDVGQGDATLIQTPDGKTMLIDGGDTGSGILPYLQNLGIQHIDLIIATHPHSDHIGGLVQVLGTIPTSKVVTNDQLHISPIYEQFLDAISTAEAEYAEVKKGDTISLGIINFLVLNPQETTGSDLNENSIVLQFRYGNTTFLLMGDAGSQTEAGMIASNIPLKADILKVGHHGSTSATTPEFLNVVKPAVAVYFAGSKNSFQLPDQEIIDSLTTIGAQVYGTDKNGTIIVTVNTSGYTIDTFKTETRAPPTIPLPTSTQSPPVTGGLQILSVTSPIDPGAEATLTAKTLPGAICTITVYHQSGPSEAAGLEPKTADANGLVSWTWKVGARTTPGTWRIVVTATINGKTYPQEIDFLVR